MSIREWTFPVKRDDDATILNEALRTRDLLKRVREFRERIAGQQMLRPPVLLRRDATKR